MIWKIHGTCSRFQAPAVPKDFPYKKMFNVKLLRLLESGMLHSSGHHKYTTNNIPECKTVPEDVASLALGPGTIICIS